MKRNIIAGLDLGTTKVCAVIAEQFENENYRILGFGVAPSVGLHKGLVANISKTAEAIKEAFAIAINKAGLDVNVINIGVAGEHITSMRHRNYVNITNEDREITEDDLIRLENDVRTIPIPTDRQILHIIPEEFIVDQQEGIENPIGITGVRLEAVNHIVLASTPALENIKKSVERAGFKVGSLILQPLASSASVLDEHEKDLGVLLIDIGGGTTDIAVIHKKAVKHTRVIGVAGNQVTNDIREALGVVTNEAEKLKKSYGYASTSSMIKDEEIVIRAAGSRGNVMIKNSVLTQIISARMRELFSIIDNEIRNAGLKNKIRSGIVLTGGGSWLNGCVDLADEVFGLPTRIGIPMDLTKTDYPEIEKPEYATVIGLVKGVPNTLTGKSLVATQVIVKKNSGKKGTNPVRKLWDNVIRIFNEL